MVSFSKKPALWALMASLSLQAIPAYAQDRDDEDTQDRDKSEDAAPWSMADRFFGAEAMAKSRAMLQASHGAQKTFMVVGDRIEFQFGDEDTFLWDLEAWYGDDENKLWIKTEGDYSFSEDSFEEAEIQALWSRAISSFWDLQTGVRYDFEPESRVHGVLGIQGLAPYWFEVDAAAFISTEGDLTARIEAEYEVLFTQRLILQPRVELELSAQDIDEIGIGSGVSALDIGVRLRYEIDRSFAPYIGVEWQKSFGNTAEFVRASGADADQFIFILGIKTWF